MVAAASPDLNKNGVTFLELKKLHPKKQQVGQEATPNQRWVIKLKWSNKRKGDQVPYERFFFP